MAVVTQDNPTGKGYRQFTLELDGDFTPTIPVSRGETVFIHITALSSDSVSIYSSVGNGNDVLLDYNGSPATFTTSTALGYTAPGKSGIYVVKSGGSDIVLVTFTK